MSAPTNITPPSLEQYRAQITYQRCRWCNALLPGTVDIYEHESGWYVKDLDKKQWLSLKCIKCDYDWSLNKLGVPRPLGQLDKLGFKPGAYVDEPLSGIPTVRMPGDES